MVQLEQLLEQKTILVLNQTILKGIIDKTPITFPRKETHTYSLITKTINGQATVVEYIPIPNEGYEFNEERITINNPEIKHRQSWIF